MKEIFEQFKISKLLVGKVLGSLNDKDHAQLNEWRKLERNQETEKQILNIESFDDWCYHTESIDKEASWLQFLNRMEAEKAKAKKPMINMFRLVASIASMLVISFALYYSFQHWGTTQSLAKVNIEPGNHHAILILDNGKNVNLESDSVAFIQDGEYSIENTKGALSYNTEVLTEVKPVTNTLRIPKGGEYQIVLSDGTQVWLNSGSELQYTVPFIGNTRRVTLKGEAYFKVAHNKEKPFIVSTDNNSIQVLGTEFNVSAYKDDNQLITTLVNGKIQVDHHAKDHQLKTYYLEPNQQTILDKETAQIQKKQVDVTLYTAWKEGRLKFKNEPLESFLKKLSRWYNVDIVLEDESLKQMTFTGDLPRYNNMADILSILEAEMSLQIQVKNNKTIYVSR